MPSTHFVGLQVDAMAHLDYFEGNWSHIISQSRCLFRATFQVFLLYSAHISLHMPPAFLRLLHFCFRAPASLPWSFSSSSGSIGSPFVVSRVFTFAICWLHLALLPYTFTC